MRRRVRDEMGEALEGDGIALVEIVRHRIVQAEELGHGSFPLFCLSQALPDRE